MVRRARVFVQRGIYHIYCRVHRGEFIFEKRENAAAFVEAAKMMIRNDKIAILAWVLMSNHYHMVLQTDEIPLWRSMLRFHPRITRTHNSRMRVFGSLWQSRYRARIIQDEMYYKHVIAYVHLNPVTAGLVSDPVDWKWSGHSALLGRVAPILVDPLRALRGFGETHQDARKQYLSCLRNVAELRWINAGVRDLPWWKRASNNRQLAADSEVPESAVDWKERPATRDIATPSLTNILKICCQLAGCTVTEIQGNTTRHKVANTRMAFARISVDTFGYSVVAVANLIKKHPNTLSRWRSTPASIENENLQCRVKEIIRRG